MTPSEIRGARVQLGLTAAALAELAGTTGTTVAQWELRSPTYPSRAVSYGRIVAVLRRLLDGDVIKPAEPEPPPARPPLLQRLGHSDMARGAPSALAGRQLPRRG